VGVIDSGIDGTHPDLQNQINYQLSREFLDNDVINTYQSLSEVDDCLGHGTMVAGIIAAQSNSMGIKGVAPQYVELISLKVVYEDENGNERRPLYGIANAIEYAASISIPILNISMSTQETPKLIQAVNNYTGLMVCSAGNDNKNNDTNEHYPSNYTHNNIIVVGATKDNDTKLESSNYGATSVDLFAPGHDILSCYPTDLCSSGFCNSPYPHHAYLYHYDQGTSFAAPYVTGVAALVLAQFPNFTAEQIKAHIMRGVDPVSSLSNLCVTGGRLNAYEAVQHRASSYQRDNVTYHKCVCVCGYIYRETHNYVLMASSRVAPGLPGITQYQCVECGQTTLTLPYSLPEEHSLY